MRIAVASLLALAACATPEATEQATPDAGADEGAKPDPMDHACKPDEHACASACTPALPNEPSNGCAQGCYEACPAPEHGRAVCGSDGHCDAACDAGYQLVGGSCVAAACNAAGYECGTYVDPLGASHACGSCFQAATCGSDNRCHIPLDALEPDDSAATAHQLGQLNDADDTSFLFENRTFHTADDEDWYVAHITDGFDAGNPAVYVDLRSSPFNALGTSQLQSPHELSIWFKCDTADEGTEVFCHDEPAMVDPVLGVGCTHTRMFDGYASVHASCATSDDSGTVRIRIRRPVIDATGERYAVKIAVQ